MTERLENIYNIIPACNIFADVGCDHGFIAKKMLDENKCEFVYISDISEKSLSKAEKLLSAYMGNKAKSFVSDGLDNVPKSDCVLIAGLGGEEIVKILKRAKNLPENIVLQPMRNCDKVRRLLIDLGYKIIYDKVFYSKNIFYDLIYAKKGEDQLSEDEILFGRTNILNKDEVFLSRLKERLKKLKKFIKNLPKDQKRYQEIKKETEAIKRYV